jgi:hypothetical protein
MKLLLVRRHMLQLFIYPWFSFALWQVTDNLSSPNVRFKLVSIKKMCLLSYSNSSRILKLSKLKIFIISTKQLHIISCFKYLKHHLYWYIDIVIDIFVNCNWVATLWQLFTTHIHKSSTKNDKKQTIHKTTQKLGRVLAVPHFWDLLK